MATSLAFLFFGTLAVAGAFSMAKIQRAELASARAKREAASEAERKRKARLAEFRVKSFRPDGD